MYKYLLKRMALAVLTLFIILFFSYTLIVSFIQNPFEHILTTNLSLSKEQKAVIQKLATEFNKTPVIQKIGTYFYDFFRFDYGKIYALKSPFGTTIPQIFFRPLKWSILVSLPSFIISALLGVTLGVFAGYKRGTIWDSIINVFVFIFIAIPSFIVAPILINVFVKIGFPGKFISPSDTGATTFDTVKSLIPAITVVTLGSLAIYTLYARNQTVTVLTSNYILIAKTKGLTSTQIFRKYVLRNISIPLSAIIIPSYIGLLSGSIIIERFWFIPGTSSLIAQAFPNGEINIVMFSIFFFTALSLFTEIFVDISFTILDPRITYASNSGVDLFSFFKAYRERQYKYKKVVLTEEYEATENEINEWLLNQQNDENNGFIGEKENHHINGIKQEIEDLRQKINIIDNKTLKNRLSSLQTEFAKAKNNTHLAKGGTN